MLKTIIIAVIIFFGMIGYDTIKSDSKPTDSPTQKQEEGVQKQEQKVIVNENNHKDTEQEKHEKKAAKAIFFALLPDKEKWPVPLKKIYQWTNVEDTIDPIRQKPNWVPLKNMAQDLPKALISIEDHDFYKHGGLAMESILRAALENLTAGKVVQGGSTLTQQLVKNIFLTQEQSMERKAEEAILSLIIEHQYSKDEIIELYLNTTYFGAGAYGIKQASYKYFDKAPSALTLAESAIIAALPYAPSALNPLENPLGCRKRQLLVLTKMHEYGYINDAQLEEAKNQRINLSNGNTF
ncbi:MAG: biosynthetic peptidoglycan transglycosylase [Phascolarctobacterium sp.]|nr:biosynthetic peptidoglycan transglycosylase [Phascolarctobacterium sp.]